jgi:uncharacterized protein (TIGR02145 family)
MKTKGKILLFAVLLITEPVLMFAQNIGINDDGSSPDSSAMLDVKSTTKGMLIPRMTSAQIRTIANPADGLEVYNTDDKKIYVFISSYYAWKALSYGAGAINLLVCGNPFVDARDGISYSTVLIGTQCWMSQNLNTGTRINGSGNQTNNNIIEKYCYADLEINCDVYGGLYQWDEAMQYSTMHGVQGICPAGWHLPTDDEWTTLTEYVNNQSSYRCNDTYNCIAKAMAATTSWNTSTITCAIGNDLSLNNATGFSALAGDGTVSHWCTSVGGSSYADSWGMENSSAYVGTSSYKNYLFSVRCIRD